MRTLTLKQLWKSLDIKQRDELRAAVSKKCGKSFDTVYAWMIEYRVPPKLDKEVLIDYIKENYNVEIIETEVVL